MERYTSFMGQKDRSLPQTDVSNSYKKPIKYASIKKKKAKQDFFLLLSFYDTATGEVKTTNINIILPLKVQCRAYVETWKIL